MLPTILFAAGSLMLFFMALRKIRSRPTKKSNLPIPGCSINHYKQSSHFIFIYEITKMRCTKTWYLHLFFFCSLTFFIFLKISPFAPAGAHEVSTSLSLSVDTFPMLIKKRCESTPNSFAHYQKVSKNTRTHSLVLLFTPKCC